MATDSCPVFTVYTCEWVCFRMCAHVCEYSGSLWSMILIVLTFLIHEITTPTFLTFTPLSQSHLPLLWPFFWIKDTDIPSTCDLTEGCWQVKHHWPLGHWESLSTCPSWSSLFSLFLAKMLPLTPMILLLIPKIEFLSLSLWLKNYTPRKAFLGYPV